MWLGEFSTGSTVFFAFTTVNSSGAPTALSSGGITVYRDASTVQNTTGVTLTASFDTVVGLNHVMVEMAGTSTHYEPGASFYAVISSGAVGAETVAGYTLAHWSVRDRVAIVTTAVSISTASLISTSNVFTSVASVTGNVTGSVGSVASATGIATAVWGATRASYTAAGSFGESISTGSSIAAATWNINAVTTVSGNVTGSVGSVASATGLATAIWGATRSSYTAAGSFGELVSTSTAAPDQFVVISTAALISTANVFTSVASVTGNVTGSVGSVASATGIATAVWGATRASYTAAGSFGESISTGSSIAAATWNITGVTGNVTGSIGSLTTAAAVQVNAEVVDALNVDTYAEPTAGIPPATAALTRKIGQVYAALRNQITVSSSAKVFYADDASVLFGKVLSQDSTGSTGVYQEDEASTST